MEQIVSEPVARAPEAHRELVLQHGWNSTCYQVLNPCITRWTNGEALVGYVPSGRTAVVAGAPICAPERISETITNWELFLQGEGLNVCYFGAEARLQSELGWRPDYTSVVLGHQPEWSPESFLSSIAEHSSLRAQLNRALNHSVTVTEWPREQAENNSELRNVLSRWLSEKGMPPLHFLVEPDTLSDLRDRRIFVAQQSGRVAAFVTLCPVPERAGWLTEQFVRVPGSPNGAIELALSVAVGTVAAEGSQYVTMGIVPLANQGAADNEPLWLSGVRRWSVAHMNRFYNFRGLQGFKAKFHPDSWQPVVVIVKDQKFRLRHLRAIARAFTSSSPEAAFALGVLKAVRLEARNLGAFISAR